MPDGALLAVKERAAGVLMRLPGVTGVGIGGRERAGEPTGELVLKVLVERKRPAAELTPGETLPARFEGVGIDVSELGLARPETFPPVTEADPGEVAGSRLVAITDTDDMSYRPLTGGARLESKISGAGYGTLGCFLVHETGEAVYALTNHHVIVGKGPNRPEATKQTRVGQPTSCDSVTGCCSKIVGTWAGGSKDASRDAALIQMTAGLQYRREVIDIGSVDGVHTITEEEARSQRYQVRKYGTRTRLTGGVVECINTTQVIDGIERTNVMVARPNPSNIAVAKREAVYFSDEGDSGSVWIDDNRKVVGLHLSSDYRGALKMSKGLALPIEPIIASFVSQGIPVKIAVSVTPHEIFVVPGPRPVAPPEALAPELMAGLADQLDRTVIGRRLVRLWSRHGAELAALVQGQQRVALVWHRCGGPMLMQTFLRMAVDHALAMPETAGGRPLSEALHRIVDAFGAYASPQLRAELAAAEAMLPDLAGLTYVQMLAAFQPDGATVG